MKRVSFTKWLVSVLMVLSMMFFVGCSEPEKLGDCSWCGSSFWAAQQSGGYACNDCGRQHPNNNK